MANLDKNIENFVVFAPQFKRLTEEEKQEMKELFRKGRESNEEESDSWPDPEPIDPSLLPVKELSPSLIPGPFRSWAVDVADRMQCPIDFIAAVVMVMTGAVIGAGCGIRPKRKDDWLVIPNLWGGVIGRPGTLKTPALQEAMKPLARLEVDAKSSYDEAMAFFEAEKEAHRAQKDALKHEMAQAAKGKGGSTLENIKGKFVELEEPDSPTWVRYKTNDATIEKMADEPRPAAAPRPNTSCSPNRCSCALTFTILIHFCHSLPVAAGPLDKGAYLSREE